MKIKASKYGATQMNPILAVCHNKANGLLKQLSDSHKRKDLVTLIYPEANVGTEVSRN